MIYFLRLRGVGRAIKIGRTNSLDLRVQALGTAAPRGMTVLATVPGDAAEETYLHGAFQRARTQGEWFNPSSGLLSFVEYLQGRQSTDRLALDEVLPHTESDPALVLEGEARARQLRFLDAWERLRVRPCPRTIASQWSISTRHIGHLVHRSCDVIDARFMRRIALAVDVAPRWLRSGEGPQRADEKRPRRSRNSPLVAAAREGAGVVATYADGTVRRFATLDAFATRK